MHSLGVDYGMRRIAVACAEDGFAAAFHCTSMDRGKELRMLAGWYLAHAPLPGHLWIEGAIQGGSKNVQTTVKLAATQGAIMAAHVGAVSIVAPSSWKAGTVLNGNANKELVSFWLAETYPELWEACCGDQDQIDAMCMSLYGLGRFNGEILEPPPKKPKKRKPKVP
jgi:hypothetical protein